MIEELTTLRLGVICFLVVVAIWSILRIRQKTNGKGGAQ